MKNRGNVIDRLIQRYQNKSFVFWDYLLLGALIAVFLLGWFAITRGSNSFICGNFYSEGFVAVYDLEGTTAKALGSDRLKLETLKSDGNVATLRITIGNDARTLEVDSKTGKILSDTRTGVPLVFFYDSVREPHQVSATFGEDRTPEFSTEFTGLDGDVHARVAPRNADNVVMWYHRSSGTSYGPQFSWELHLYEDDGTRVGTMVNDITSGLLLDARFYQDGWGAISLAGTNYPTGMTRWAGFIGCNIILVLWGIYHLLRARKHSDEWYAHWSSFPLDFVGISRFYVRLLAWTTFGFLGMGILTGDYKLLLVLNFVGLALMVYATGPFAFPVFFNFIPWISAILIFAGGRSMDYVQYPFGVLLYLTCVLTFLLYRYLSWRQRKLELEEVAEGLPEEQAQAVMERIGGWGRRRAVPFGKGSLRERAQRTR